MSLAKHPPLVSLPLTFRCGLFLAAGFMAFTAWDQSYWWRLREDYTYGWLVPLFIAYLLYDRWPRVVAQACGVKGAASGRIEASRWFVRLVPLAAAASLVLGGALFLAGAFYKTAAGTTHLSTFAITAGMAGTVLATIYLLAPARGQSIGERIDARWRMVRLFLFPTLIWFLSAPLLSSIENNLNLFLMRQVTSTVFFVFDRLGLPLEQQGNVLVLPTGSVGVEEACSGVRSLTGCLFAATFLAAVFLRSRWKQAALVLASLLFAFLANLLRSIFLTSWAYRFGAKAIEGTIHDLTGYGILGLTVVALLCLLPVLDRRKKQDPAASVIT